MAHYVGDDERRRSRDSRQTVNENTGRRVANRICKKQIQNSFIGKKTRLKPHSSKLNLVLAASADSVDNAPVTKKAKRQMLEVTYQETGRHRGRMAAVDPCGCH
jgi:hypothetical protein